MENLSEARNKIGELPGQPENNKPSDSFNYDGYQIVRGEFFAHLRQPCLSFCDYKIAFSSACIKKFPEVQFVQLLVNTEEKILILRPSNEYEKDALMWCTLKGRKPRAITCHVFFAKIFSLMGWSTEYRYKLLGKIQRSEDETIIIFDLKAPEIFKRTVIEGSSEEIKRPSYLETWKDQFGMTVEEHRTSLKINIIDGYVAFQINREPESHDRDQNEEENEACDEGNNNRDLSDNRFEEKTCQDK